MVLPGGCWGKFPCCLCSLRLSPVPSTRCVSPFRPMSSAARRSSCSPRGRSTCWWSTGSSPPSTSCRWYKTVIISYQSDGNVIIFTVRNEIAKVMFLQVCVRPRGGVVSQHALQVVSQHALQQVWGGWWYPSMPCSRSRGGGVPAPGGRGVE